MPRAIARDEVQRLVREQSAQLVDVLPRPEYEWAHLPGAIHLSLKQFDRDEVMRRLDRDRPVIVYCNGFL